jgi:hypothetical protein
MVAKPVWFSQSWEKFLEMQIPWFGLDNRKQNLCGLNASQVTVKSMIFGNQWKVRGLHHPPHFLQPCTGFHKVRPEDHLHEQHQGCYLNLHLPGPHPTLSASVSLQVGSGNLSFNRLLGYRLCPKISETVLGKNLELTHGLVGNQTICTYNNWTFLIMSTFHQMALYVAKSPLF